MFWGSVLGSILGAGLAFFLLLAVVLFWDELDRRRKGKSQPKNASHSAKDRSLDEILESQLEQHIVSSFDSVFPGWTLHSINTKVNDDLVRLRRGVRFRTEAGEIDLLCLDDEENLVVVELKRNKAPDTVVAQVDRYIAWVERNLAQPSQKVRGIIIARSFDKHIEYTLSQRNNVQLWAYNWCLDLKVVRPAGKALSTGGDSETQLAESLPEFEMAEEA